MTQATLARLKKQLANLDCIDRLRDNENITNLAQIKHHLYTKVAVAKIKYFAQVTSPSIAAGPLKWATERLRCSYSSLIADEHSPPKLCDAAWEQASMRSTFGGLDYTVTADAFDAIYPATIFACWPRLCYAVPALADATLTNGAAPAFVKGAIIIYQSVRAKHKAVVAAHGKNDHT